MPMEFRRRVAHHEAAHAVIAYLHGLGLSEHGIDLDAETSVEGAYGGAGVLLIAPDPEAEAAAERLALFQNLMVVCAGAASDAKIELRELRAALSAQPGDERVALSLLAESTTIEAETTEEREAQTSYVLQLALGHVREKLDKPEVWNAVTSLADKVVRNGGVLSKSQIDCHLEHLFPEFAQK